MTGPLEFVPKNQALNLRQSYASNSGARIRFCTLWGF